MGRYARRPVKIDKSTHPTYATIWGAKVEVVDTDTNTVVKTFQVDNSDGQEAVRQASTEALEWLNEQNRLIGELEILEKQALHVTTALSAPTTKDRELAKDVLDALGRSRPTHPSSFPRPLPWPSALRFESAPLPTTRRSRSVKV